MSDLEKSNLKEELEKHQRPVTFQISALLDLLEYQRENFSEVIFGLYIVFIKEYITKELDKLIKKEQRGAR